MKLKPEHDFSEKKYKVIEHDFADEADIVRHNPAKLATAIMKITEK